MKVSRGDNWLDWPVHRGWGPCLWCFCPPKKTARLLHVNTCITSPPLSTHSVPAKSLVLLRSSWVFCAEERHKMGAQGTLSAWCMSVLSPAALLQFWLTIGVVHCFLQNKWAFLQKASVAVLRVLAGTKCWAEGQVQLSHRAGVRHLPWPTLPLAPAPPRSIPLERLCELHQHRRGAAKKSHTLLTLGQKQHLLSIFLILNTARSALFQQLFY